jgi:hypothetical protein
MRVQHKKTNTSRMIDSGNQDKTIKKGSKQEAASSQQEGGSSKPQAGKQTQACDWTENCG